MKEKIKLIEEFLMENFPHLFRLVTTDDIEIWIKEKEDESIR